MIVYTLKGKKPVFSKYKNPQQGFKARGHYGREEGNTYNGKEIQKVDGESNECDDLRES